VDSAGAAAITKGSPPLPLPEANAKKYVNAAPAATTNTSATMRGAFNLDLQKNFSMRHGLPRYYYKRSKASDDE
jgi:hypothetical protein